MFGPHVSFPARFLLINPEFRGNPRFEIQRRLGEGGMGVVYKAHDHERAQTVALKTMRHIDGEGDLSIQERISFVSWFFSRQLGGLYELFSTESQLYFTMEYVDGCCFDEYVRGRREHNGYGSTSSLQFAAEPTKRMETGFLPGQALNTFQTEILQATEPSPLSPHQLRRLRSVLAQVVSGISTIHECGYIHHDIKSSNILVSKEGRVVLLDFGLIAEMGAPTLGGVAEYAPVKGKDRPIATLAFGISLSPTIIE